MKWVAASYLKLRGWKFIGELPSDAKFIVIGAPHTSNWDFVIYLAAVAHWDFKPRYLAKHTLFEGPFGWLFRRWGGISVDRRQPGGLIGQVSAEFDAADQLVLAIAPEGTREAVPYWKSGFLTIANEVGAPILPVKVDYVRKQITLGLPIAHRGDIDDTMAQLRVFYQGASGKNAVGMGPVRVKEESAASS
ncbi:MAG TPA: 1-acyl-sn-glycerol-3-phosphate acyltransferase [Acidimicrobiia bacterium]